MLQVRASLDKVNEVWSSKRCVIHTPTVEAGVNFDGDPLGLMQMTGRPRKLRNNVVYCATSRLQYNTDVLPVTWEH